MISLNFRESEQNFGGFTVNGTWNGIIALLANEVKIYFLIYFLKNAMIIDFLYIKSADIILQFFTYQEERDSVLYFGNYFPTQKLIAILSVPTFRPENVLKIFFIFGPKIWILIFLSLIVYSIVNGLIKKNSINSLSVSIDYFGILTGQGLFRTFVQLINN